MNNLLRRSPQIIRNEGVISFLRKLFWYIHTNRLFPIYSSVHPLLVPYVINKLRSEVKEINEPENLLNYSFSFDVIGLRNAPLQKREEILELLKILKNRKIKTVLEIGTARGGTLFLFSQIAHPEAAIISVDLPKGKLGGYYPSWKRPLYKSFAKDNREIHLIRASSHDNETLEKVKKILKGRKIDFLFIDGDHTYEGVKKDFEMYGKLVRRGVFEGGQYPNAQGRRNGIIAFHDIVPDPCRNLGAPKFWNEIKKLSPYLEIIKSREQGGSGIGIIYV